MNENRLAEQLTRLREAAKTDKQIDVASLMVQALENSSNNLLSIKEKRIAYLLSIGLPLVGFFFAIKFFLSDKDDAQEAALACVVLSCLCLILTVVLGRSLGSNPALNQLNSQSPQDLINLVQ